MSSDDRDQGARWLAERVVDLDDARRHEADLRGRIARLKAEVERLQDERDIALAAADMQKMDRVRRIIERAGRLVAIERDEARRRADELEDKVERLREEVLRWAADQLRALPMPTTLTGPYWYGQAYADAADHLDHLADARQIAGEGQ